MNVIYQSFHPSHDLFHLQGDFKMAFSEKNYTMSTWNDNFVSLKATWFDFTGKKKYLVHFNESVNKGLIFF